MDIEARLEQLETRLMFYEDNQQKFDDVLRDQQQQLLEMRRLMERLVDRLYELETDQPSAPEPPPPHY